MRLASDAGGRAIGARVLVDVDPDEPARPMAVAFPAAATSDADDARSRGKDRIQMAGVVGGPGGAPSGRVSVAGISSPSCANTVYACAIWNSDADRP